MSRRVSVCLVAVVALVALLGAPLLSPAPVLAASGTLGMETPLHESPDHGAPLIALLPEGTIVSIDGPPVDGFYPVSTGTVSGWMRGETLLLEKDIVADDVEASPTVEATYEPALVEQTTTGDGAPVAPTDTVDPAVDPASTEAPATDPATDDSQWVEPAPVESAPVESAPVDAAPPESATKAADGAPAVPDAPASDTSTDASAAPAPDQNVTPVPAPETSPVGPASVTVDAPIRTGPGPGFDLVFTVPMGSTLEQTGNVIDGYVTVQYKEVTGWAALEHLGTPSSFVPETPPGEMAAPVETPPAETPPAETPPVETPPVETPPVETPPVVAEPVAAEPVAVKTPRPGSGVAFTTVDMSLRNGPSATEEPITVVPAGSRVVLTGVMEGGFQRVTYGDQIGWIADEYLQSPADPEPDNGKKGKQEDYSRRQIVRIINDAADRYGQSRSEMLRVAECESNLNPYAVNPSGSYGLFQFIRTTWKSTPYGNKDIFDPEANANAAAWMWAEGRKSEWVCQ